MYAVADRLGRKFFNDIFYRNYAGLHEDRLWVLGEELFEKVIQKRLYREMLDLIKRSRQEGYQQVLVTGAIEQMVRPLARYLEVDAWFANQLDIRNRLAYSVRPCWRVQRRLLLFGVMLSIMTRLWAWVAQHAEQRR